VKLKRIVKGMNKTCIKTRLHIRYWWYFCYKYLWNEHFKNVLLYSE